MSLKLVSCVQFLPSCLLSQAHLYQDISYYSEICTAVSNSRIAEMSKVKFIVTSTEEQKRLKKDFIVSLLLTYIGRAGSEIRQESENPFWQRFFQTNFARIHIDSGNFFQFVHKSHTRESEDSRRIHLQESKWILIALCELLRS